MTRRAELLKLVAWGTLSALLYVALFANEGRVVEWMSRGGVYALIPLGAAFAFSLVHGVFTGRFWTVLGITERRRSGEGREPSE